VAALSLTAGAAPASASGGYPVTATITVGSEPSGVAVDPATGTVYVVNYVGGSVSVIDEATATVTDTVAVGAGPGAVAVDPATHAVYVANGGAGTVSVISAPRPAPAITVTSSRNPATFGQNLTLTASADPAGRDTITAAYPGDPGYAPAAGTLTQTITRAPTTLTERIRTAPHHALILTATLTASGRPLSAQPVTFSSRGALLCTALTSTRGTASCATAGQPGHHHAPIQATYPGNVNGRIIA
jgi:YVTN family beta-propeller protein